MDEKQLIDKCLKEIEASLHWGKREQWGTQDFEELSDKIFDKTQIRLSVSTLKRVWGKIKYESSPNIATLNALAQFCEYENWKTYRQKHLHDSEIAESQKVLAETTTNVQSRQKPNINIFSGKYLLIIGILSLIPVTALKISKIFKANEGAYSQVSFESIKVTDDLPNSVIFNYRVTAKPQDSIFIQQNWDPKRRERISADNHQHTSIYYYPGNFTARLIVNDKVIKEERVYIQTKGWKGIIERSPTPIYLGNQEIELDNAMGIKRETLREKIGTPVFNDVLTRFYNVREFGGITNRNFSFEAIIQNTSSIEESICRTAEIYLLEIGSATIIPLSDKGCISKLGLLADGKYISGKENDLSWFGCDFSKPQKVKCEAFNKELKIYLNDELVYNIIQTGMEREIIGLSFSFEGTGEIGQVKLGKVGEPPVYEEKF